MNRILLLLTFFILPFVVFAQKNKIEGKITDAKNGSPLSGVSVIIKESGKGVSSNLEGRFVLLRVQIENNATKLNQNFFRN